MIAEVFDDTFGEDLRQKWNARNFRDAFEQIQIQDNIVDKTLGRVFYTLPFISGSSC